jgi:hypothetical protein
MKKKCLLLYTSAMSEIPHSLAIIAAVFKEYGYEVKTVINTFKRPVDNIEFLRITKEFKPDIVGISMLTMQILKTYELIGLLKKQGYPVIVGGTHATAYPTGMVQRLYLIPIAHASGICLYYPCLTLVRLILSYSGCKVTGY